MKQNQILTLISIVIFSNVCDSCSFFEKTDRIADSTRRADSLALVQSRKQRMIDSIAKVVWERNEKSDTLSGSREQIFYAIDNEGKKYKTIQIGKQIWMAENLDVGHYNNGVLIPIVEPGKTNYYTNGIRSKRGIGTVYNWFAVMDKCGICPNGWHIPSTNEWKILKEFLGQNTAIKMIENPDYQSRINKDGVTSQENQSGFSAKLGGVAHFTYPSDNPPSLIKPYTCFWTSDSYGELFARFIELQEGNKEIVFSDYSKNYGGFFVRCLYDYEVSSEQVKPESIDGQKPDFPTVKIRDREWMTKNLNVTKYQNGDPIEEFNNLPVSGTVLVPLMKDGKVGGWGTKKRATPLAGQLSQSIKWDQSSSGAYCYYDNEKENADKYGLLYNWRVAVDPRGICPKGWHVPRKKEWENLINVVDGRRDLIDTQSGTWKLNPVLTPLADDNYSGFSALASGRYSKGNYLVSGRENSEFNSLGMITCFWSSDSMVYFPDGKERIYQVLYFEIDPEKKSYESAIIRTDKEYFKLGIPIRCIKD